VARWNVLRLTVSVKHVTRDSKDVSLVPAEISLTMHRDTSELAFLDSSLIMSESSILRSLKATLGADLVLKILSSKLLLVGAGGIGCELLKNLALTGFTDVTVIDLDTIDVSNLNRQLLFRSHHVGQPKCVVACAVAKQLSIVQQSSEEDSLKYVAHHGNVCDNSQFHAEFVKQFDVVLNALDNVVARRRVNRLCLAASVPLIEAGTTGYLGQVTTIHKPSNTACYECQTQETGKVYPICTIRSTPSAPVHCIVWAKELYKLLFGNAVEESMLYEDVTNASTGVDSSMNASAENGHGADAEAETGESSTYMHTVLEIRQMFGRAREGNGVESPASVQEIGTVLVRNLFVDEIQKQLNMNRYKTAQKTPVVLREDVVVACATTVAPTSSPSYRHTDIWTPAQCVSEIVACIADAINVDNCHAVLPDFDKDDNLCMRFVTAASNLRSTVFGIEPIESFYSAKGIAGNIIPAIATTNAIVAGLQILQCFQVLRAQMDHKMQSSIDSMELASIRDCCSYVNCLRNPTRNGLFLTAAKLEGPNPKCFVCSKANLSLQLNVNKWTLADFISKLCKKEFGFESPIISIDSSGDCIWEEGEDADSESFVVNLNKLLPQLPCGGIIDGTSITIEDFTQDLTVEVGISHVDNWNLDEGEDLPDDHKYVVVGGMKHSSPNSSTEDGLNGGAGSNVQATVDDDDEIEVMVTKKRSATTSTDSKKKAKMTPSTGDVIEIDE
jgi:ubiquitin-like 1-activating enzyme E1 B